MLITIFHGNFLHLLNDVVAVVVVVIILFVVSATADSIAHHPMNMPYSCRCTQFVYHNVNDCIN